jgi:flagellar motor switch protein FliG
MATPAMLTQPKGTLPGSTLPYADSGRPATGMPGLRKAAILMMAIGDELAKIFFQSLSDADVQHLTEEITRVGQVPQEQLTQVLLEFYELLETEQYVVRGGVEYARRVLTEAFGVQRAAELLLEVEKIRDRMHGDLAMLQKMDPQQLSKFLANEHPQTVALVLAHLDPKRGSIVLMHLDEKQRVESIRRLAEMRQFSPEMAHKVGLILHRRMAAMGSSGRRSYAGFKAVAELLNRLNDGASKHILEEIEREEPKLAIGIRNLMFTFDDLLTVSAAGIRELVGAADKRTLAIALKTAKEDLQAHLLQAMSSRAVEMLREDMEAMGPVRNKDVSHAQQELVTLARTLESEGRMTLKLEGDDELSV